MSEYVKNKKDMKFQSQEALQTIHSVIKDAEKALNDKSRTIKDSPLKDVLTNEVLGCAVGAGIGGGIGFATLYFGGSVVGLSAAGITSGLAAAGSIIGGGMVAGIGVLAAPAVILGGIGVAGTSYIKNKKLREAKEITYKEALAKQNAILQVLKDERNADKERIEYLNKLNILLQAAIKDLQYDLGYDI